MMGTNMFADRAWHSAELKFSNFIGAYTNSPLRTEAVLYLARARIFQSNFVGALDVLNREMPKGPEAANYVYWMAAAFSGKGDYTNAITSCSNLLHSPAADSRLRLSAAFLQAQALSKLADWPGVGDLLSNTNGAFQSARRIVPDGQDAINGLFLLGEAYRQQGRYRAAEEAIRQIEPQPLPLPLQWQRQWLLCRILLDDGRPDQALRESANLTALSPGLVQGASSTFLRGEVLERLYRTPEAIQQYTNNLAAGLPPEVNRQALADVIRLSHPDEIIPLLAAFMNMRPKDVNLDMARFYLGDQYLKQYFAPLAQGSNTALMADTNLLQGAITNLDRVITDFPESSLRGNAHLDRGWGDWAQTNYPAAISNFLQAVLRLPSGTPAKAVATFKLADALFKAGDYAGAVNYYNALLKGYDKLESVTNGLFDLALYQLVEADVRLDRETAADSAAKRIIDWFPASLFGGRSLLLLGEDANQKTNYARAREVFSLLLDKYPETPLKAEVQAAIAHTFEQEGDWNHALGVYTNWLDNTNFATNAVLRPRVEYARALDWWKAGLETNALLGMSNIVLQFPTDALAPEAQYWIGDYYMNHPLLPDAYPNADYAYQQVYDPKKFPQAGLLAYQAHLMAGRAAVHYALPQASNDFVALLDTNAPSAIRQEACFQLGCVDYEQFVRDHETNENLLISAISALSKNEVTNGFLAAQAFGQLGACLLADVPLQTNVDTRTATLTNAANMFQAVLDLPRAQADASACGQARFGLGQVAKLRGQPEEALLHYLEVVEGDPRDSDPYWIQQAGVAAAELTEAKKDWITAANVYNRVKRVVPSLAADMDKRIEIDNAKMAELGH
jgi:tetratricopeptide (TPR) repeat protein